MGPEGRWHSLKFDVQESPDYFFKKMQNCSSISIITQLQYPEITLHQDQANMCRT